MSEAEGFTVGDYKPNAAAGREPQRPLYRPLPPPAPFPLMALGPLRKAAEAIHVLSQAPDAICAQSVLAVATLAAQPHVNVVLPYGSPRPLTCYFVTIAESGERKSGVDRLATRPVLDKEHALRQLAEGERSAYAAEKCAWEAARDAAKKKAKSGDNKGKAAAFEAIEALGSEPRPPASPMLLAADPTPEGLTRHLGEGRPWAGVFTAEGGTLLGGHGFSDDARMRTGALFNALWDGDPIRRLRQLTGQAFLTGRRCAMHVMVQPVAAGKLLADPMLEGLGLLARMLFAAPVSTAGTRMHREPDQAAILAHGDYCQRIGYLLDLAPPMDGDGLAPRPMGMTDNARALFIVFSNLVEAKLAEGGSFRTIRGFGSKLAEHAARLAAVLAFYERGGLEPEPMVQEADMANGIALAEYYAGEMLRLLGSAQVGAELQTAQSVLGWLKEQGRGCYHLAEVYQRGPSAVRTAADARAAMMTLAEHGHLRALKPGSVIDGSPRQESWELIA